MYVCRVEKATASRTTTTLTSTKQAESGWKSCRPTKRPKAKAKADVKLFPFLYDAPIRPSCLRPPKTEACKRGNLGVEKGLPKPF